MAAIVPDNNGQKNTWSQAVSNGTSKGIAALSYLGKTVTYGASGLSVGAVNALAILKQVDILAYATIVGYKEAPTVLRNVVGPVSDQVIDNFGTVALAVDSFVLVTIAGSYYLLGSKQAKVVDDNKKIIEEKKELEKAIGIDSQKPKHVQLANGNEKVIEEKKESKQGIVLEPYQLEASPEDLNPTAFLEKSEEASGIATESNTSQTVEKVLEQAALNNIALFGLLPVETKTLEDLAHKVPGIEVLSLCNATLTTNSFDPFKKLTTLDLSGVYFESALNLPSNLEKLVISQFDGDKLLESVSKLKNLKEIVIVENQEQKVDGLPANMKVSHLNQREALEALSVEGEVR
ncbi:MAG: hypothetical protein S4CHLAM123_09480 [Chlamydiales bacterium]|nr:hypothetical protein [Chlamydiales bacterium]